MLALIVVTKLDLTLDGSECDGLLQSDRVSAFNDGITHLSHVTTHVTTYTVNHESPS